MLIEQSAYANRWRTVAPSAKSLFALGGLVAAFAAEQPRGALGVAALLALATVAGAGVKPARFLRVALAPLGFLLLGCLSLAYSLDWTTDGGIVLRWLPEGWIPVARLATRAAAALAALLFLTLTTPLTDLVALLRRLRFPSLLLELMVLCYRMLFVFSETLHDTRTAQAARLGYATPRHTLRSLGGLAAHLTLQVWQRTHALNLAAQSRNIDGALRFLEPHFADAERDLAIAALGGAALVGIALGMS